MVRQELFARCAIPAFQASSSSFLRPSGFFSQALVRCPGNESVHFLSRHPLAACWPDLPAPMGATSAEPEAAPGAVDEIASVL